MMQKNPFVSIIIPLYNKAGSIRATLRSAASQSDADNEIIIVDDGSTDGSAELVKAAGVRGARLIQQANAGVSAARNRGIVAAKGKWIALLDADDVWAAEHLAWLLKAVRGSEVIAAFSNLRLQTREGRPLIDPKVTAQKIEDYFSFALRNGGYPISSSSIVALRDHLLTAGLFDEAVTAGEDIDMWCRLACRGPFFYNAKISATYNDALSRTLRSGQAEVARPIFSERLPELIRCGAVPRPLVESGRRYANFLMLEHARRLIDSERYAEARATLLNECVPSYDLRRFAKRLARTWAFGRALFRLSRSGPGAIANVRLG